MKKIIYAMLIFVLGINIANAKPVPLAMAKTVAQNYYKQHSNIAVNAITLAYTEVNSIGLPVYYIFDVNNNDGWIIVSAEDAVTPVIGYNTQGHYIPVPAKSNIAFWMEKKSAEITTARNNNYAASEKVAGQWTKYTTITTDNQRLGSSASTMSATFVPLVQSHWNQNGGGSIQYNNLCPGGSVTGCVATTMSQIMRYWSYPAHGTGSHSYTQSPNANNYPAQSANFGATTYNWANMPLNGSNADVAQLMYQCGVSVNMHYDPSGSGAQVLGGNPSAQYSYKTYFGYNPSTLAGYYKSSFSDANWVAKVESDLNIGRPVQYVGADSIGEGHTWVCDGYDDNLPLNNVHMNWGWGGAYDGYYSVNDLTTGAGTPGVYDPRYNCSVLMGIVPPTPNAYDAGIPAIMSPLSNYCNTSPSDTISLNFKLLNYGSSQLNQCDINYQIDGGTVNTISWTGSLAPYQSAVIYLPAILSTVGTHTFVCYSANPNGTPDQNTSNDQATVIFKVKGNGILPLMEGFESASSLPNANWTVSHSSGGVDFAVSSMAAATGSNSVMLDNLSNTASDTSVLQTASYYNLSSLTTPMLTFKAAYQEKATSNTDKLQIFTSTDCGNSWISRKVITASTLASLAGGTGSIMYMPSAAQFTTYSVTITAVASSPSVMFKWAFMSGSGGAGNDLYIDDINILDAAATGIENIEAKVGLSLYPNPSYCKVNIDLNLTEQHNISVNVTDMIGRTVETIASKSYQSGETTLTIGNDHTYQAGVYLVNINIDGQHISKKVIMQ